MEVKQFYDEGLAQASYGIFSDGQIALVDPARDPQAYEDWAQEKRGKIVSIFETHPHADFASGHLELSRKHSAPIYVNPKMGVFYDHQALEDGDEVELGKVKIRALFTPGHSPDHHSYLLLDESGNESAVFTGDSLFVGDVGRPDLREDAGNFNLPKEELAEKMYDTVHGIFGQLDDSVAVYPAHGAGSACGKNMVEGENSSSIGKERKRNWALKEKDKEAFVEEMLSDQPSIPKYFPFEVELNRKGLPGFEESVAKVERTQGIENLRPEKLIIDARPAEQFRQGHLEGAINIPDDNKFENWLGTLIAPEEKFYLIAAGKDDLEIVIRKAAKIGYEQFIEAGVVAAEVEGATLETAPTEELKKHPGEFHIVDVRNENEVEEEEIFQKAKHIPLTDLREKLKEIPDNKPIAVHCAGGYRSAIASSIIAAEKGGNVRVMDISDAIEELK